MASGIARGRYARRRWRWVTQDGSHTSNNRLTCSLGLPCTFSHDIRLWLIDTCQIKLSTDQYHVTISQALVYSSSRSRVLLKLTADRVLVFYLIAVSCQVNCWKLNWTVRKPINSNPDLKVNQIITVSSLKMFELFFCKKIPLSRRVGYVMDRSMGQWVSEGCMYVTPIRLDLP